MEFFTFTGMLFWALVVLGPMFYLWLYETEKYIGAFGTLIVCVVGAYFLSDVTFASLFTTDALVEGSKYFGGYVAVGIVWAVLKWLLLNKRLAKAWVAFRGKHDWDKLTDVDKSSKIATFKYDARMFGKQFPPIPSEWRDKIVNWIVFWPWSAFTFIPKAIVDFGGWVYDIFMDKLFRKITSQTFDRFDELRERTHE